jgi:AcrR family transcriptional regulator
MTRSSEATRKRILETAYDLFYQKGYGRVGIDDIAERANITKRTLYYHFESKDELLARVLEFHHGLALTRIQGWSARLSGDVNGLIDMLFAELAAWAGQPRWQGAGFTRLVMELADLPGHPARAIARRHKAAVEHWLATQLAERHVDDAEGAAKQVMLLLEGCLSLLLIHGDKLYADRAADAAKQLVARPTARHAAIKRKVIN